MPKARTEKGWGHGELLPTEAGFSWRVRLGKAGRKTFALRPGLTPTEAEGRRAVLVDVKARLKKSGAPLERIERPLEQVADADAPMLKVLLGIVAEMCGGELKDLKPGATVPTFRQVAEDWTSGRLAQRFPKRLKMKRTANTDEFRLGKHIYPHPLASKPIDRVTLDDCEDLINRLPSELSEASVRQVAQILQRVFRLAEYPLKLIPHSPLPRAFLPPLGERKALNYLYADEDRRLLAETSVPLQARLLWGFLAREGMRLGEALALTWGALDLERGTLRLDENKTDDPRAWALDPGVARALACYRDQFAENTEAADLVFTDDHGRPVSRTECPTKLRAHLRAIGLDAERPELFERSKARRPIRVHDLRATFITHSLANGKTETWISDRTGHASSKMIHNYKRAARTAAELGQGELAPLDQAIPELTPPANLGGNLAASAAIAQQNSRKRSEGDSSGRFR